MGTPKFVASWSEVRVARGPQNLWLVSEISGRLGRTFPYCVFYLVWLTLGMTTPSESCLHLIPLASPTGPESCLPSFSLSNHLITVLHVMS